MTYQPKPKDTSKVRLGAELKELTERLAQNTHDIWAQERLAEGWRYGPERNDARKEHPSLVPYDQLSESEKEYDRRTALETIKMLLALGYTVESPEHKRITATGVKTCEETELVRLRELLAAGNGPKVAELVAFWNAHDPDVWSESPEAYRLLAEAMLRMGEPLLAYDVVDEGLKYLPTDVLLRQLLALALARSGASNTANSVLLRLYQEGHQDEETLGLLARTHKDLADATPDAGKKKEHLRKAHEFYTNAYERTGGYWTGINAATTAVLLGERDKAIKLAGEIREICRQELARREKNSGDLYWTLAALGEAALILGEWSEAEDWYSRAREVAGKRYADLHSSRRNARLLMAYQNGDRQRIELCFRIPAIAVFAGHMVDQPGRPAPRFPPQLEEAVRASLQERLKALNVGFGYSSVACGSDILFAEALLDLGGDIQVVLPYDKAQFIKDSVETTPGGNWGSRCEAVLKLAAGVTVASDQAHSGGTVLYEYANLLLLGLAEAQAQQLDTSLAPMAVWDGQPGDGPGGTASTIERWRKNGSPVEIIRLDEILRRECPDLAPRAREQPPRAGAARSPQSEFAPDIRGLLFADAVGFSKLSENEVPLFVRHFLGLVGELADQSSHTPIVKNTWGDGLYFVFTSVSDAGQFALELCERIGATRWSEKGLRDLNLRIGVHAGPVYACLDPITRQNSYIGAHVSRAARIEPITPPGHVYASQAFAALAAAERVKEFTCDYVGRVAMAKNYGTFSTFVVRRRA